MGAITGAFAARAAALGLVLAILVARVSSATLDSLATFETSREDLEENGDHEPSIGGGHPGIDVELDTADLEPDHDDEYDYWMNKPH